MLLFVSIVDFFKKIIIIVKEELKHIARPDRNKSRCTSKGYWGEKITVFHLEGLEDHRQKQQALGPTEPAGAVSLVREFYPMSLCWNM